MPFESRKPHSVGGVRRAWVAVAARPSRPWDMWSGHRNLLQDDAIVMEGSWQRGKDSLLAVE